MVQYRRPDPDGRGADAIPIAIKPMISGDPEHL
jgi:hypothetical protein